MPFRAEVVGAWCHAVRMATNTEPPPVDAVFLRGVSFFDEVLSTIPADSWNAPSPCEGWSARDVVGHVVGTMTKGLAVLTGAEYQSGPSEPGEQSDPVTRWPEIRDRLRDAVRTAPLEREMDSPQGRRSVADGLRFPAADLAVHAWDVAAAAGRHVELPEELRAHVVATCQQVPEDVLRSPGRFGPARQAPTGADETTKLMAWLGRAPVV